MAPPPEEFIMGWLVAITTSLGEEVEGEVIAFDKTSNCVVLLSPGINGVRKTVRFLRANCIRDCTIKGHAEAPLELPTTPVDLDFLRSREEAAIRQAELEAERIGVGVSQEAQDLYDALAKTLPVRWDKTVIVVMDDVRVSSPYLPENVAGGSGPASDRVKKVLEFERRRLQGRS